MLPGILRALSYNINRSKKFIKLFEIGSINHFNKSKYNNAEEERQLCILWYGNQKEHWKHPNINDIYTIKGEIQQLLNMLKFNSFKFIQSKNNNFSLDIIINKTLIGNINIIKNEILKQYDIKSDIYYCSINLDDLSQLYQNEINYIPISAFPVVKRDISILVKNKYSNKEIEDSIIDSAGSYLSDLTLFDLYEDKNNISVDSKSLAYSLTFLSNKKTLQDKDVDIIISNVIKNIKKKFNVIQR